MVQDERSKAVSRRQFMARATKMLAALGLGTQLVVLPGCGGGGGDNLTTSSNPTASGTAPAVDIWQQLANRISGVVLRPGEVGYKQASTPSNLRYASIQPAGVAACLNASDVAQSILWARQNGVRAVPRSGGHSYGGYSTTQGLIINLGLMKDAQVNPVLQTVKLGPGNLNRDIYAALAPYAAAVPAGRCPTVAVSGLTLGGGFGFTSRSLGATVDKLIETEIVTADGRILTCNAQQNSDLFWACRGGGGGTFGINTSYTLQITPIGNVSYYEFKWDMSNAAGALKMLQGMVGSFPDALSCRAGIGAVGAFPRTPGPAGVTVDAIGIFRGPQEGLVQIFQPLLAGFPPISTTIRSGTFDEAAKFTFLTTPVDYYAVKSSYAATTLSDAVIDTLIQQVQRYPGSANPDGGGVALFLWGGALNAVPRTATAFVHRDARWLLAFETSWEASDGDATVNANLAWLKAFYDSVQPAMSGEAYQNFIDPDLTNWQAAYYAENFSRLVEIKAKYDPTNFFSYAQSIPTS